MCGNSFRRARGRRIDDLAHESRAARVLSPGLAARVMRALAVFGAPPDQITEADFASPGVTYQIGVAPGRIDILTDLTGLTFDEAWPGRITRPFGDVRVAVIGLADFIRNKRATGRAKVLGDIEGLE